MIAARALAAGEKASRQRQRHKLIEATISALYAYGPSRTTVDKVVSIADMSPGIVSFYFGSKAAMLVAALQFLADEFALEVLEPVARLGHDPVAALERLVELYLDPQIASPRKVSVWYAFWGEASARQQYQEICGKQDAAFARLVRELVGRLVAELPAPRPDAAGIALGLIGALEMLWQEIAFQTEDAIDRAAIKRRCMAYLGAVFPGRFDRPAATPPRPATPGGGAAIAADLPGWAFDSPGLFAEEMKHLFLPGWQVLGREDELPRPGDYLAADLMGERVLVVRDRRSELRAFRNLCRHRPHALVAGRHGHLADAIACPVDGWVYDLAGGRRRPAAKGPEGGLLPLALASRQGWLFVQPAADATAPPPPELPTLGDGPMAALGEPVEREIAADWKAVVDQLVDSCLAPRGERRTGGLTMAPQIAIEPGPAEILWRARLRADLRKGGWTARRYHRLLGLAEAPGERSWLRLYRFPNLLVHAHPEAIELWQVLPLGPGRCRLRRYRYGATADGGALAALRFLGGRLLAGWLDADLGAARSMQAGFTSAFHAASDPAEETAASAAFRGWLRARLPMLEGEPPAR